MSFLELGFIDYGPMKLNEQFHSQNVQVRGIRRGRALRTPLLK